jgi:hypothetical protein
LAALAMPAAATTFTPEIAEGAEDAQNMFMVNTFVVLLPLSPSFSALSAFSAVPNAQNSAGGGQVETGLPGHLWPTLEVQAELVEKAPTPTTEAIRPYSDALGLVKYRVLTVNRDFVNIDHGSSSGAQKTSVAVEAFRRSVEARLGPNRRAAARAKVAGAAGPG